MNSPKSAALSLGLSALILYLAAHAVTGRHGLASYMRLQEQHHALSDELAGLEQERTALGARLRAMSSDHLDRDALEEQARRQFAAAHPDELIFELEAPSRQ